MNSPTLRRRQRGISLVLTLALVVIATILVTGFLVATRLDQTATASAAGSIQAEEIASGAMEMLIDNLRREIAAGSTVTNAVGASTATLYLPKTNATMQPRRLGFDTNDILLANLVRISSASDLPASYPATEYDQSALSGRMAASPAPEALTTSQSSTKDGRFITTNRWRKPQLVESNASFPAPAWVMITRSGPKPAAGQADVPGTGGLADPAITNTNCCIGRVAFAIYDQGGLLNINLAGFPGTVTDTRFSGGKNSPVWADLAQLGFSTPQVDELVAWRNAASAATGAGFQEYIYNEAATNGFTRVRAGDNTFLSRQEMIRYFQDQLQVSSALPSLGTFSYGLNAPAFTSGNTQAARYFHDYGTGAEPLRRFPLNPRLALLTTGTDSSAITLAFGLAAQAGWHNPTARLWTYPGTAIQTIDQAVAAGREPNLFEILKTAIVNGSLAATGGNSSRGSNAWETSVDNHIIRLGANIIDQYDSDNYPTTIQFNGNSFYGIEDLPYFSEMFVQTSSPQSTGGAAGASIVYQAGKVIELHNDHYFELWNPHQAPLAASPGPSAVRIRNQAGTLALGLVLPWTRILPPGYSDVWTAPYAKQWPRTATDVIDVNLTTTDYRNPRVTQDGTSNLQTLGGTFKANAFRLTGTFTLPASATYTDGTSYQVLASNYFNNTVFVLEYQDTSGTWRPYTTLSGLADAAGTGGIANGDSPWLNAVVSTTFGPWASWVKPDPRTDRMGIGRASLNNSSSPNFVNQPMVSASAAYPGQTLTGGQANATTFPGRNNPAQLAVNTGANASLDPDNTTRPGDAALSSSAANPMTIPAARPVVLNRPFRSIGELGYVFRDQPWKTLDFFSASSADAALLDAFCLEDTRLIAGQTSLNTGNSTVLRALLSGAATTPASTTGRLEAGITTTADALAAFTRTNPVLSPAQLVTGFMGSTTNLASGADNSPQSPIKQRREAVVRALASSTQTRTWNLLIDLIAQSGRYTPKATTLGEFIVQSERRYWLHLAIDRYTGEIIARQLETVQE